MLQSLYELPDIHVFIFLSLISIVISVVAIYLVKRMVSLQLRYKDNSVIGDTSALISVIYGVLAGLTAVYLINNINYTDNAVQREANAVADLYSDSLWMKEPLRSQMQTSIKNYLQHVINIEWPLMKKGAKLDDRGNMIISTIGNDLTTYDLSTLDNARLLFAHDAFIDAKNLYDARQQRVHMSGSALNPEIWVVILLGSVLTLCINYLFGMNFYLHIVTVSAAALMASSIIFLLVTLDRPFQGEFVIEPDAFKTLLSEIHKNETRWLPSNAPKTG